VHLLQDFVDEIPTPELAAQDQRNQKAAVLESAIAEQEWGLQQVAPLPKSVIEGLHTGWSRNPYNTPGVMSLLSIPFKIKKKLSKQVLKVYIFPSQGIVNK
jgi:hypothetical protein